MWQCLPIQHQGYPLFFFFSGLTSSPFATTLEGRCAESGALDVGFTLTAAFRRRLASLSGFRSSAFNALKQLHVLDKLHIFSASTKKFYLPALQVQHKVFKSFLAFSIFSNSPFSPRWFLKNIPLPRMAFEKYF